MKQQQKLTPQQVMLMRLLHMPLPDLLKAIKEEVEKNPLLEAEDMPMESLMPYGDDNTSDLDDDDYDTRTYTSSGERDGHEWQLASEPSFAETLHAQLDMKNLSPTDATIGHELIGSLDDNGYLARDLGIVANDLALYKGLDVEPKDVENVLHTVQSLDPAGIAARSLQECLSLQLHRIAKPDKSELMAIDIVDKHFALFSQHRFSLLADKLKTNDENLKPAIDVIQRLNPKPGESSDILGGRSATIIPDIEVFTHDDTVSFAINDRYLPKLRVDKSYMELLQSVQSDNPQAAETSQTAKFINSNSTEANLFIEALNMRHHTMERVMKVIVKRQKKYFLTGVLGDLKPMMQKEIADDTGLDVSTVSRMVNSKYAHTPFGMIRMRDLFTTAVTTGSGEEVSSEAVKDLLRNAVKNEDKRRPLTDDELAAMLNKNGFSTARRTVAKYREALGIPVARLRKGLLTLLLLVSIGTVPQFSMAQSPKKTQNTETNKNGTNSSPHQTSDRNSTTAQETKNDKADRIPGQLPATLWYGNNFSDTRVRLKDMPLDSLPDEINLRLLRKGEQFAFPVKSVKSSPYGWRWERPHRGVDIALKTGEPIHCVFDGVVRIAKPMGGYGNLVVVRHYNGLETVYGHLSKINVKPRQEIKAGDVLGLGGSTGHSTGPHLHFEVRFQYETFDPEWILDFSNYTLRTQRLHLDKSYFGIKKPRGRKGESLAYKADKSYIKEPERKGSREMYYVFKSGDSLAEIAHRYSTTIDKIRSLNENLPPKPKPGTRIRVR